MSAKTAAISNLKAKLTLCCAGTVGGSSDILLKTYIQSSA